MRLATFKQFNESSNSISVNNSTSNSGNYHFQTGPTVDFKIDTNIDTAGLGLDKQKENVIKQQVSSKFEKLSEQDKKTLLFDLTKLTNEFGCELEDLTDPTIVKDFIEEWCKRKGLSKFFVKEGFWSDLKDKVIKALGTMFEWAAVTTSFLSILLFGIQGSFWGVVIGALALSISLLVSGLVKRKFFRGGL